MLGLTVLPRLQQFHQWLDKPDARRVGLTALVAVVLLLLVWLVMRLRRPSAEEMERRRRERLAIVGRITDGSLIDARTLDNEESVSATPEVLVYRYRLSGVIYECAQDVSRLPDHLRGCQIGSAVQVRYDPRNPGDSILLAETWSGLWLPSRLAGKPLSGGVGSSAVRRSG